ncbi:peptidase S41 [Spirosoma sp. HMF4905]|uniref:Tricorn protease homolog n=1 Tax=Spirosoma arboris TaxID=2682092 RepID=A0A7K1SC49_9BACT|nr:S41 family peptidase [Spirosoma arboris]MVM31248.1 peptidase S41 [Spirosoma arboris]
MTCLSTFLRTVVLITAVCSVAFAQKPLWMRYPAISPDGQTIVFSYQGDLYRVATTGGQALPLTIHESHDFMPVWSHDGKSIAFASDRYGNFDVFVMPATGGEAKRLTFHSGNDLPSDFTADNQRIIFSSARTDDAKNAQFPLGLLGELYSVPTSGGRTRMELTTPAELARFSSDGKQLVYQDMKGYEDAWRKHHVSSITRDLWVYDVPSAKHTQLTNFAGEDRNPVLSTDGQTVYYLSEQTGSFNVHSFALNNPTSTKQLTSFHKHPVRFLSSSQTGTLCFGFDGEIYTLTPGEQPKLVNIQIMNDGRLTSGKIVPVNTGATDMALSPNGKEIAFISRGEVFVTSVEGGITKRVTNTPEQERSVSFSPNGRSILYAAERQNNWNVYETSIVRKEEPYFYAATVLNEKPVVATQAEEFQPEYSPDGKEIAYLEARVVLKVFNLATKATRTVLPADKNYSYSDGDQHYAWSPDGKWFLVDFAPTSIFTSDVGLVAASGKSPVVNLTQSGYNEARAKWVMGGKAFIMEADRDGMKNHGSWGGESDVYAMFFSKDGFDRFRLSKDDASLAKEREKKEEDDEKEKKEQPSKKGKKADTLANGKPTLAAVVQKADSTIKLDLDGIEDRKLRLTIHSSRLADMVLSKDGEKLYYLARFEKTSDLWVTELRTKETKILAKDAGTELVLSKDGKSLFVMSEKGISKIDAESGKKEPVTINGEMMLSYQPEKAYIFDHAWRQVREKFYVTDLHGVNWADYYTEYKKFLPYISNNRDFAELLSEMLGELNASHTGCRYAHPQLNMDATASLGLFYDQAYAGDGLKITEVMKKGPLDRAASKIKPGVIIEQIDGAPVLASIDYYQLLNRKADKNTLLSLYNPTTNTRWEETLKPITLTEENELRYHRWVQMRRKETDELSGGKVGYVHVRGMNDASYRTVYEEVLGKCADKESVIIDTRFNGGGWLHDDLATLLSGQKYIEMVPRGQKGGHEPMRKWIKPSVVLVSESNYSDAHMFPYAYRANNLGKIVGMPVPGTGTAVWWETQIDPTLVFGIPQVGMITNDGKYMENTQLEPDVKVQNEPGVIAKGKDQQLGQAVDELLKKRTANVSGN